MDSRADSTTLHNQVVQSKKYSSMARNHTEENLLFEESIIQLSTTSSNANEVAQLSDSSCPFKVTSASS